MSFNTTKFVDQLSSFQFEQLYYSSIVKYWIAIRKCCKWVFLLNNVRWYRGIYVASILQAVVLNYAQIFVSWSVGEWGSTSSS